MIIRFYDSLGKTVCQSNTEKREEDRSLHMVEHTEMRENTNCYTPRILLENMEGTNITSKVEVVVVVVVVVTVVVQGV